MATNAATKVYETVQGAFLLREFSVAAGTDYTTGGIELTPTFLGVNSVERILTCETRLPLDGTKRVIYDPVTNKVIVLSEDDTSGVTSAPTTSDQTGVVAKVLALTT